MFFHQVGSSSLRHLWIPQSDTHCGLRSEKYNNFFCGITMILYQVFGGCFVYLSLYAVNQAQVAQLHPEKPLICTLYSSTLLVQVQRLLTLPSLKKAQAALWLQVHVPTMTVWYWSWCLPPLPVLLPSSLSRSCHSPHSPGHVVFIPLLIMSSSCLSPRCPS